jgi:hypothetical protein
MAIAAFRYNNPFDVSLPIAGWNGGGETAGIQGQPGFGAFPDMATGYKAGVQRLNSYISGQSTHGAKRTIKELNSVYATDPNWHAGVAAHSGLDPNAQLDPTNADQMRQLQYGVMAQEIGPKNAAQILAQHGGGSPVAAINNAAGIARPTGGPALAFSGDDEEGGGDAGGATTPARGTLSFGGNNDGSGKQDNRFGIGDLFGASDETKAKMHGIGARLVRAAAALSSGVNPNQSSQLNALGKSLEEQNKTDYQYTMGPNGQLVKINKDTGEVSFATLPGGGKGSFGIVMGKNPVDGTPMPIGKINHSNGEFTRYGGDAPAQTGPQPGGDPNLSGQERFDSMAPDDQREVTAMLEGRGQPITSLSLRNPVLRARYEAARAVDPSFDTAKYAARQKMVGGLAQSTPGSAGGQLDSSGAMISHVTDLADDYIKLHNSGGYGATLLNAGKNLTSAAGSERDQLLKPIATHSMNFSGEVTKQLSGAPGGQEERQRRVGLINQPNAAPSTQAAALEAELMDAINKRQATLDRVKDTMGEAFVAQNPRFKKQEEALALAKSKLETLRNGPAIKDAPKQAPTIPSSWEDAQKAGWK